MGLFKKKLCVEVRNGYGDSEDSYAFYYRYRDWEEWKLITKCYLNYHYTPSSNRDWPVLLHKSKMNSDYFKDMIEWGMNLTEESLNEYNASEDRRWAEYLVWLNREKEVKVYRSCK